MRERESGKGGLVGKEGERKKKGKEETVLQFPTKPNDIPFL